jgi:hypothetical protein
MSDDGDQKAGRANGRTFATLATIIVALAGLLSSTVWGPPICRAIGLCGAEPTPTATSTPTPNQVAQTSTIPTTPPTSASPRPTESGYPASAADYCAAFVRAWQDHYQNRAADLSTPSIAATVFKIAPPVHYRNESGPTGNGAACTIVDTDNDNAQVIKLFITKPTGRPGAITNVMI